MSNLESSFGSDGVSITLLKLFSVSQNIVREPVGNAVLFLRHMPTHPLQSLVTATAIVATNIRRLHLEAQPSPHLSHPPYPATSNRPSDTEFNLVAY
jgi:hypothetical protein